jgi:Glyoxalase-like domain
VVGSCPSAHGGTFPVDSHAQRPSAVNGGQGRMTGRRPKCLVSGTVAPVGSVGLEGIEPSTSPLSGLYAIALFALVRPSGTPVVGAPSRYRPASGLEWAAFAPVTEPDGPLVSSREPPIRVLLPCTDDSKVAKERMHLDLESDDVEAEVQRFEALGATRWNHQQERGDDFWVMRDPWGNEFCVLQPEHPELFNRRKPWESENSNQHVAAARCPSDLSRSDQSR